MGPTIRWLGIAAGLVGLLLFMSVLPVEQGIRAMETWIDEAGWMGHAAFVLLYAVATVLLVPGSPWTLAAGAVFGLWEGLLVAVLGSNLGAAAALLIGRHLARDRVRAWAASDRRFQAMDSAIAEGGWRIVALLRLSPAIPFNLQNYLYGLTPIPAWTAVLTSVVAMLPGTFLYVYLGYLGRAGARASTLGQWVLLGVGLAATVGLVVYVSRLARRQLEQQTGFEAQQMPPPPASPWTTAAVAGLGVAVLAGGLYARLTLDGS